MPSETRLSSRLFFAVLLIIFPAALSACDLCGCFIGVLPYDNQSSLSLMHRYRVFSGYSPGTGYYFPSGSYRVSPAYSAQHGGMTGMHSSSDYESYKSIELRGKWFIHPRIELNFVLPFLDNKMEMNGERTRNSGLGDLTLLAGYHLIRKTGDGNFRHRLLIGAGVKLPTGKCSATDASGMRMDFMQQTGTGSTDAIIYSAYTGGGFNFRWGITGTFKMSGTNRYGEQVGWAETGNAFAGYLARAGKYTILPAAEFYQERMDGVWQENRLLEGTGMNALLGGLSVSFFRGHWNVTAGAQLRVYDHTSDENLLNKTRVFVSLSWNFNQSKYLLSKTKKQ